MLDGWLNFADRQDRYSPRDEIDPRIRPVSTPGWTTWNVRAAWEASERVYTSLQFGNIGDRRYREFGSGLDAPGRGIVLTLELRM
jgi:outer membrane receptor protein involved in Fe transport